jgi:3-dehydroquinate synthetase
MVIAARLSETLGYAAPGLENRIKAVLGIWSLPTRWGGDGLDGPDAVDNVYAAMLHDKKRKDGKLRLVLPFSVGETKLVEGVEEAIIREALVELQ